MKSKLRLGNLHAQFIALGACYLGIIAIPARAATYPATILSDSPIAFWSFSETNASLQTATNLGSLGASANGQYQGGVTLNVAGPRPPQFVGFDPSNTAVGLDGASGYVGTTLALLNNKTAFTLEGWVLRGGAQANRTGLFGQNDLVEFGYISDQTLHCWINVAGNGLNVANPFPDNQWHHVAVVGDGTNVVLYSDGQVGGTANLPAAAGYSTSAYNFNIGGGGIFDATGNFFLGQLDEVAVFDKALTASQIQQHYYSAVATAPIIATQPQNTNGYLGNPISLSVTALGTPPLRYQWQKAGVNIANATNATLVLTPTSTNDAGSYRVVITNAYSPPATSAVATVAVFVDSTPPTLVSAGNSALTNVVVHYSEPVEPASATNAANYGITSGITISAARLTDAQTVTLSTSPLTSGSNYTLTVNGVRDLAYAPNVIATNSQITFTALANGMVSRPAVGPFLNNQLPSAAPGISGNWSAVVAFTNLLFTNALGLAPMPGTSRLIVWEREGRIFSFTNAPGVSNKTLVLDISNQCQGWDDSGLLNVVFHPGFTTNHYIFVYYTWVTPGTVVGSPTVRPTEYVPGKYHDRLSRFTLDANGVAVPGSEVAFVDQVGDSVWHNGSGMFFHPLNGFLYYTDGDDERAPTQVINQNLFSGVFRIDVDMRGGSISHPIPRQPANGTTANYYIPNDNPFVGQANVLEEFYALGLRSPHRMTIDPPSRRIFIGDVGAGTREELDVIEPSDPSGLNFQWNYVEGFLGTMPSSYIGVSKPPILDYPHTDGHAIIGGYVYRGAQFAADLGGKYIFGDNVYRNIWALDESTTPATKTLLCVLPLGAGPNSGADYTGLSSFGLDHNNELYICQMSSVGGRIYKLARSGPPPAATFPPLISQIGAFTDLASLTPSSSLIPYTVNSPLWSDGAFKQRWIAVPTNTLVHFAPTGEWTFPNGTVFVKNFTLPVNDANPGVLKRLETRFLVRDTNGMAYGITYKWRTNYTDADLVTNAITEDIIIATGSGTRTQTWFYPGPQDCLQCHTRVAGHVLGVKTRQLNGNLLYPGTGVTDNQLRAWNNIGLFDTTLSEGALPSYAKLVHVMDSSADLTNRVRSYLDSNCAQCHRPGGAPAFWDARYDTPLASQNIINGNVADSLGITNAHEVTPLDTSRSIMYLRMNSLGSIQMPPLARNTIDTGAVTVLAQWINSIGATNTAPVLAAISNRVILAGRALTFTNSAIDTDTPPQTLTYSLIAPPAPPAGASVNPSNGIFSWRPAIAQVGSNWLNVRVTDNGFPNLSATQGFGVTVSRPAQPALANPLVSNGQFSLLVSGDFGPDYTVLGSTNLANWQTLFSTNSPALPFLFVDPAASNASQKFYRVLLGP